MCIDSYADISIHTPTRGTTAGTGTATNLAEFQSTFPREERPYYTIVRIQVLQFQSTLPREERPFPTDFVTAFMPYFNPRSHERSDDMEGFCYHEISDISIHAPTRGATDKALSKARETLFQSTLPREERLIDDKGIFAGKDFNPRSHERSDRTRRNDRTAESNFNPRSHERSDSTVRTADNSQCYFNPRSHERSDSNIAQKICLFLYNTDNKYIIR